MVKGYIDNNNESLFVCPNCGFQRKFNALPFKDKKKTLTIKCQCGQSTEMQLEFRKYFRKQVGIPGSCYIEKDSDDKKKFDIIIKDISLGGVGIEFVFVNKKYISQIGVGDIIVVEFNLDEKKDKPITKRCAVRIKMNNVIGAEFVDENYSQVIGFYMMK
ncbi:MAG: PilZ domain-containing protein [Desulfamplus sp.]|nr:PilZ domain-containing protein [Desulfamplus sp.]